MDSSPLRNITYPKIPVKKRAKKEASNPEDKWIVLEKIHGCNFSFVTNGTEVGCARRTELLTENETFYGWQSIRDKHKDGILKLYLDVKEHIKAEGTLDQVLLFGELFGGIYPHPDVTDLGLLHCQKGVYYSPAVEFLAFDILYTLVGSDKKHFLQYKDVMAILKKHDILCIPPLFEGTMEECFKFDIKRNSSVPQLLGYPPLNNNQIEGVVIKELDAQGFDRKIFKYKNPKFEEVNPKVPATLYEQKRDAKTKLIHDFFDEIDRYINENRLNNLRSKIGEIDKSRVNDAGAMLAADALEDFILDNPQMWEELGNVEMQDKLKINIESKCKGFIQVWLVESKSHK